MGRGRWRGREGGRVVGWTTLMRLSLGGIFGFRTGFLGDGGRGGGGWLNPGLGEGGREGGVVERGLLITIM